METKKEMEMERDMDMEVEKELDMAMEMEKDNISIGYKKLNKGKNMKKRDLLKTFINLLPKASTLSEDCDEWGKIKIDNPETKEPGYLFDYHVWHNEDIKLYIYPIVDEVRTCDEKFIYNKTTDKIELCMFTDRAIEKLIGSAKK